MPTADLLDAAPDGIAALDAQGVIVWANAQFGRFLGREVAELNGTIFDEHLAAAEPLSFMGFLSALTDGPCSDISLLLSDPLGSPIPAWVSAARYTSAQGDELIVVLVRASREIQEELAESSRWAATEQERAQELARARDALAAMNTDLKETQAELIRLSRIAGRAEIASGVLHNVGNVINSISVAAGVTRSHLRRVKLDNLKQATCQISEGIDALPQVPPRLPKLARYVAQAVEKIESAFSKARSELGELEKRIVHVEMVISTQQEHAKGKVFVQVENINQVVEEALRLHVVSFESSGIELVRELAEIEPFALDRHRILQILVNLLRNAKHAVIDHPEGGSRILVTTASAEDGFAEVIVRDYGKGIPEENLVKIFAHGFTTKASGHGFGLHSSAVMAKEMGGSLTVTSGGLGQGARFVLRLPKEPPASKVHAA